jgi:hypothetical protein
MPLVPNPLQRRSSRRGQVAAGLAAAYLGAACNPEYVVGIWACPSTSSSSSSDAAMDGGTDEAGAPFPSPWSTGFEDGFCGYQVSGGYCYSHGPASYKLVTSPVHSGRFAAAFTVDSTRPDNMDPDAHARCVQRGVLPNAAYYGAWYLIPSLQANSGNWNLIHFQGGSSPADRLHGLWDVSLINDSNGGLKLNLFDFLGTPNIATNTKTIPIGSWFHIEIYLQRAADAMGEIIVYQDRPRGADAAAAAQHEVFHLNNVVTDDSSFAEWYVGNLATSLMPADSTVYVDDVEISETLP